MTHNVIQPDSLHPRTATELLEQILARDAAPQSATTVQREQQDPAVRLGAATARYLDALHLAAPRVVGNLDGSAELLGGLTAAGVATLRAHLMLLAAAGADPVAELFTAAALQDPMSAGDQAAVIDSRIHDINKLIGPGLLPWLPGIPHRIANDPNWGPYLTPDHTWSLSSPTKSAATPKVTRRPGRPSGAPPVPAELIADVQLWRAATQVDPTRPATHRATPLDNAAHVWQQQLDKRLAAADTHADLRWRRLPQKSPATADPFLPELEERLHNLTRAGFDATLLVRSAAAAAPTRRPPRRSPLVAHPRPATANAEPRTRHPAAPSDQAHSHDLTRPAATCPRSAPPTAYGPSR